MNGWHDVRVFRFPNFEVGDVAKMPDGWKPVSSEYRDRAKVLFVTCRRWRRRKRGHRVATIARKIRAA